jgi:hypothetical protein
MCLLVLVLIKQGANVKFPADLTGFFHGHDRKSRKQLGNECFGSILHIMVLHEYGPCFNKTIPLPAPEAF